MLNKFIFYYSDCAGKKKLFKETLILKTLDEQLVVGTNKRTGENSITLTIYYCYFILRQHTYTQWFCIMYYKRTKIFISIFFHFVFYFSSGEHFALALFSLC